MFDLEFHRHCSDGFVRQMKVVQQRVELYAGTTPEPPQVVIQLRGSKKMDLQPFVPLAVTTVVAVGGWFVAHTFSARRDRRNKLVDLRTDFLLGVHRRLERSVGKPVTRSSADDIEAAIADLQLMGSSAQASLARGFIKGWGNRNLDGINISTLLRDLRDSLRRDLGLEPIPEPIEHFRLHLSENAAPPSVGSPAAVGPSSNP